MSAELSGKIAIVTGGTGTEGLTAAEAMLKAGAWVSIWDDDAAALKEAADELNAEDLKGDFRVVDVADPEQVEAAYEVVRGTAGPVDVLLTNATLKNNYMMGPENPYPYKPVNFWELNLERFQRTVAVNIMGAYLCMRAVTPEMVERRSGSIIAVGTSDHTQRSPEHIPYGPSKAMLEMMCLGMAEQLKPFGVRLNVIEAGGRVNQRGEHNPKNHPFDVMVPAVLYLAGDASRDVTGQVLPPSAFQGSPR